VDICESLRNWARYKQNKSSKKSYVLEVSVMMQQKNSVEASRRKYSKCQVYTALRLAYGECSLIYHKA
jgi:hypothetical protein